MAKKHVFPICSQSSLVFDEIPSLASMVASDAIVTDTFTSKTYHNDDGVVVRVFEDQQELVSVGVIVTKESNRSEILVKLDQTKLDDFLSSESLTEWEDGIGNLGVPFTSLGGVLYPINDRITRTSRFWKELPFEDRLRPGHIICLASSTPTGVFRNENQEPLVEFPHSNARFGGYNEHVAGNTDSVIEYPFNSSTNGESIFSPSVGYRVDIKQNKWATFMWTGTRWVMLGSNNWF